MELLCDQENLAYWLTEYGALALFCLLALEIIALPIPGEPLMVLTGVLLFEGDLALVPTLLAAYAGAVLGISVSYLLGRTAGSYLVINYGSRIGLSNARMQQVNGWFSRFGKWTLVIGYFVPGLRHFTGFTAGMALYDTRGFMLFAYTGALVWVSSFLALGYFFGDLWVTIFDRIFAFFRNLIV
jgi:membrane protein DedA with SNARE-associated domain